MIYEILSPGADNARTGADICRELGITPRELMEIIEKERRKGRPICASTTKPAGYFLAANKDELQRYCRSLLKRAGEIHKTRKKLLDGIEQLPEKEDKP